MTYGGKKDSMTQGGSSRAESRAGGIMTSGGRNSDFSRIQGDLRVMSGWHLEPEDLLSEADNAAEEKEMVDADTGATLNSCSSKGKLHAPLLAHQMSENTPPHKKRRQTSISVVWAICKRVRDPALLGPIVRRALDGEGHRPDQHTFTHVCTKC